MRSVEVIADTFSHNEPHPSASLQTTVAALNLLNLRVHDAEVLRLVSREHVHRLLSNVKARVGVVDGEDVDRGVAPSHLPARAAVR